MLGEQQLYSQGLRHRMVPIDPKDYSLHDENKRLQAELRFQIKAKMEAIEAYRELKHQNKKDSQRLDWIFKHALLYPPVAFLGYRKGFKAWDEAGNVHKAKTFRKAIDAAILASKGE